MNKDEIKLDEKQFTKYYKEGATINDLCMIFNCSKYIVNKHIKKFHLSKSKILIDRNKWLVYPRNEYEAYLIGYLIHHIKPLYTSERFGFRIVWKLEEEEIIGSIFEYLKLSTRTYYDKSRDEYFTILYEHNMYLGLIVNGFRFGLGFTYNPIKTKYQLDFIRGFVDGGFGTISCNSKIPYIQIKSGYNHLRYILNYFKINNVKAFKRNKEDYCVYVRFTGEQLKMFLRKLYYKNCICSSENLRRVNKILKRNKNYSYKDLTKEMI